MEYSWAMESGRIGCDKKRWDDALRVIREGISMKEDEA